MRPRNIFANGEFKRRSGQFESVSTATLIFDHLYSVEFKVNFSHLRMSNRMDDAPVVHSGRDDYERIVDDLVSTRGTVMQIVDYYIAGATVQLTPEVAEMCYTRIENHIGAHIRAMQSSKHYQMPNIEDFRQMTDFAMGIRELAMVANPQLDSHTLKMNIAKAFTRPTFVRRSERKRDVNEVPKPIKSMDFIERFNEMYNL